MYTEGFEGLEEAERESRTNYGTSSELDRLSRENKKLKESLEKEKFFNKLLDQEIQELKTSLPNGGQRPYESEYWSGGRRVSRGAFYTLLFVSLLMAAYIGYGIYYDKKFSYLRNISLSTVPATTQGTTGEEQTKSEPAAPVSGQNAGIVRDSVPTIIGDKKVETPAPAEKAADNKKLALTADEQYDEEEVNAAINEPATRRINQSARTSDQQTRPSANEQTRAAITPAPSTTQTSSTNNTPAAAQNTPAATPQNTAPAVSESRTVLGTYKISSKANFYNGPDENTMRGSFISASGDKTVSALEDKNGFIYVEYTNDLGFTSKGWLSKKDLTKE